MDPLQPFLFRKLYASLFSQGQKNNNNNNVLYFAKGKDGVEPSWLQMRKVHHLSESESLGNSCSRSPIKVLQMLMTDYRPHTPEGMI